MSFATGQSGVGRQGQAGRRAEPLFQQLSHAPSPSAAPCRTPCQTPFATRGAGRSAACQRPAGATDDVFVNGYLSSSGLPGAITIDDTLYIGCASGNGCGSTYADSNFLNNGTVVAAQSLNFLYASNVWTNGWQYRMDGDVGLTNAAYGGTVINNGLLAKTAGSGESSLASISLSNTGSIAVQTGTLRLPANFTNDGLLMGTGTLAAGQITNQGTIIADASPAAQPGTLALQCAGACSFAAGTDILVLDATGSLTGQFANLSLAGFGGGAFDVVYDLANSDVYLHVTQDVLAAVAEPENYAPWLGGLGAMGLLMRRRPGR